MNKFKELTAVFVLILFLAVIGFMTTISFPAEVSAGYFPIITLPPVTIPTISIPPDIFLLTGNFREISTGSGAGDFTDTFTGGLDYSMDNTLAVGSLDEDNPQIRFFDGEAWFSRSVDFRPTGLEWELDYRPDLYASDSYNDRVYISSNPTSKFPQWQQIAGPGTGTGEFNNPLGMTIDSNDNLYVVDSGNDRIQRYNDGEWNLFPAITGAGTLVDIAKVGSTYFVTDFSENCLWYKFSLAPWTKIENASYLNYPTFLDADSDGNLYIVSWISTGDEYERAIVKYSDGAFSVFVSPGEEAGNIGSTFSFVEEICINHHDRLFYSDNTYSRVVKEKDDINELTGLTINDFQFQLMPGWSEAEWTVEPDVDEASIVVYRLCPYSVVEGDGLHPLEFGENIFPVVCTPEKGLPKEYTITITRELSDNALLSDIAIDSISLDGFNPNIFAYAGIDFPYEKETIELTATPQDINASVSGTGTIPLEVGNNLFIISVTAQDGVTAQQYLVAVHRDEAPASASPSASPSPSPSASPTASPSPTPAPTPTGSTTPAPTPSPSGSPSSTPEPSASIEPSPTPTPEGSSDPSVTPTVSPEPSATPLPSPTVTPMETDNPNPDDGDGTGFGNWIKEHPGITAAAGVVAGGTFILVTQQIIKRRKKKKTD